MPLIDYKINQYQNPVSSLPDNPRQAGITTAELKAAFDANATGEIKTSINAIIDDIDLNRPNWDFGALNSHGHDNKEALDQITGESLIEWDTAFSNNHSHANKAELDLVLTGDVAKWNGKADADNVILKDNAEPFTPTGMYQPATKKYVDDTVVAIGSADMTKAVYDPNGMNRDVFEFSTPRNSAAIVGNVPKFDTNGTLADSGLAFSIYNGGLRITYDDGQ